MLGLSYLIMSSCQMICWKLLLSPPQWIDGKLPASGHRQSEGNFSNLLLSLALQPVNLEQPIKKQKENQIWIHVAFLPRQRTRYSYWKHINGFACRLGVFCICRIHQPLTKSLHHLHHLAWASKMLIWRIVL